jgi:REP element-mobilizing transposase RayT
MPIPLKYLADLDENGIYHIYNRTSNKELLFLSDENRLYFLKRYKEILSPFIDTYCWSLLPNHFHLLIRVKSEDTILTFLRNKQRDELTITEKRFLDCRVSNLQKAGNPFVTLSELLETSFKRFFQSYALAFNKQHGRKGNLFYKPFKRIRIKKQAHFTMTVIYIHANAAKHKLVKDFTKYIWSSWQSILSDQPTLLLRNELIEWFGGIEECIRVHKEMAAYYFDCETALED